MTSTSSPEQTTGTARTNPTTDLALIAGFAALICACALLPAIPTGGQVPITLQTFAVMLAGAVLGMRRGFLAVLLYLVLGAAGLPVFSGGAAGLGVFQGPSMGYLIAFPFAAGLCGFLVERFVARPTNQGTVRSTGLTIALIFLCGLAASVVFIHPLGIAGMAWRIPTSLSDAFLIDRIYWPGDIIKNVVMAIVAASVLRAFPDLLRRS